MNLQYLRETRRQIGQRKLARRSFLKKKFHEFIPLQAGYVSNRYWNFGLPGFQIHGTVHIFRKREFFIIPRLLLTYVALQYSTKCVYCTYGTKIKYPLSLILSISNSPNEAGGHVDPKQKSCRLERCIR